MWYRYEIRIADKRISKIEAKLCSEKHTVRNRSLRLCGFPLSIQESVAMRPKTWLSITTTTVSTILIYIFNYHNKTKCNYLQKPLELYFPNKSNHINLINFPSMKSTAHCKVCIISSLSHPANIKPSGILLIEEHWPKSEFKGGLADGGKW